LTFLNRMKSPPPSSRNGKPFRRERHLDVLVWLLESNGVEVLTPYCVLAVLAGEKTNLKLIERYMRWLRDLGAQWDENVFHLAVNHLGIPIEALRWLLNSDCPRNEEDHLKLQKRDERIRKAEAEPDRNMSWYMP